MNVLRAGSARRVGLCGSVLIVLVTGACAPATAGVPVPPTALVIRTSPATAPKSVATPAATTAVPASPIPHPAATPRGPDLEATEPGTVSLASGSLQLVEFFRFT